MISRNPAPSANRSETGQTLKESRLSSNQSTFPYFTPSTFAKTLVQKILSDLQQSPENSSNSHQHTRCLHLPTRILRIRSSRCSGRIRPCRSADSSTRRIGIRRRARSERARWSLGAGHDGARGAVYGSVRAVSRDEGLGLSAAGVVGALFVAAGKELVWRKEG